MIILILFALEICLRIWAKSIKVKYYLLIIGIF